MTEALGRAVCLSQPETQSVDLSRPVRATGAAPGAGATIVVRRMRASTSAAPVRITLTCDQRRPGGTRYD